MRELKELVLPQLVEARKRDSASSPVESPVMGHSHQFSPSSTMSDTPSSPTFSLRSHSRMQSSASSLPSSPIMRESSEAYGSGKRPLTEVKEEDQEKDEDYEMVSGFKQYEDIQGTSVLSLLLPPPHPRHDPPRPMLTYQQKRTIHQAWRTSNGMSMVPTVPTQCVTSRSTSRLRPSVMNTPIIRSQSVNAVMHRHSAVSPPR